MSSSFFVASGGRLVIDAHRKKVHRELTAKLAKKGVLTKLFDSNKKRTSTLDQILAESDDINVGANFASNNATQSAQQQQQQQQGRSNSDFLRRYTTMPKGGPSRGIALHRAHHLTEFLTTYILNAFQSGHFDKPELPGHLRQRAVDYVFEISKVELMPDLSALKIYWLCDGDEEVNVAVEAYLEGELRSRMRSSLTANRVISYVPPIVFVRDNSAHLLKQLDEMFAKAKRDTDNFNTETEHDANETQNNNNNNNNSNDVDKSAVLKAGNVANVYGVDFNAIMESLKNKGDQKSHDNQGQDALAPLNSTEPTNDFSLRLKAFHINKRLKSEKTSKSVLALLDQIEYEKMRDQDEF